jgi:hypothetical protein
MNYLVKKCREFLNQPYNNLRVFLIVFMEVDLYLKNIVYEVLINVVVTSTNREKWVNTKIITIETSGF